jgi:hypothetical protein
VLLGAPTSLASTMVIGPHHAAVTHAGGSSEVGQREHMAGRIFFSRVWLGVGVLVGTADCGAGIGMGMGSGQRIGSGLGAGGLRCRVGSSGVWGRGRSACAEVGGVGARGG